MQLFIDTNGAFLGVRNGMFWVKTPLDEGRGFVAYQVNAILLAENVRVSTNALQLALELDIPVTLVDSLGAPIGQCWSGQYGSISTIRKKQAIFTQTTAGLAWVAQCMHEKIYNQRQTLLAYEAHIAQQQTARVEYQSFLKTTDRLMQNFASWRPLDTDVFDDVTAMFRGWEGTATRRYFMTITRFVPREFCAGGRSRRPAFDAFNALLNYLYGMLYTMVELSLLKAGIDPYMGVLHIDRHNRPVMVYDCIESYRHWAEAVAIELCIERKIQVQDFHTQTEREGVRLARSGKSIVIDTFLQYLKKSVPYGFAAAQTGDKQYPRKRSTHIDLDAQRLATLLKTFDTTPYFKIS